MIKHPGLRGQDFSVLCNNEVQYNTIRDDLTGLGIINYFENDLYRPYNSELSYAIYQPERRKDNRASWSILTNHREQLVFSYEEWKKKLEEKWVKCINAEDAADNLTLGKEYLVIDSNSSYYYYIVHNNGSKDSRRKTRFEQVWPSSQEATSNEQLAPREVAKPETRKIIGYKAPTNMYNGNVKAGDLYVGTNAGYLAIPKANSAGSMINALPVEIVIKWEPAYEEEAEEFTMGTPSRRFKMDKGKLWVYGCCGWIEVSLSNLTTLANMHLISIGEDLPKAEIATIKIGVETYTINELRDGIHKYYEYYKNFK